MPAPIDTSELLSPNGYRPPFQALVFDLGGVVVAHDNGKLYDRLASRCAGSASVEAIKATIHGTKWGTGAAPISDLHGQLRSEHGYALDWAGFVEDWSCHFELDESMLTLVRELSNHNRVIIFSNTNKEHWDFLVQASMNVLDGFERYLSHEIGQAKPSVESFNHVAEASEIEPAHSIFFDDLVENVEGARRAGFKAEVFEDEARLRALLTEHGVRLA